jgi:dTDP-4-dehydrorhamnose reductase
MTRILVTGAGGLLGLNFSLAAMQKHEIWGVTRVAELCNPPFHVMTADLAALGEIQNVLEQAKPELILHTAALAIVDACEQEPEKAQRINAAVPGELAAEASKRGIQMIYISTDAVFDGVRGNYTEEDTPNPLSIYARTKLAGEQAVTSANPEAIIARVNFYGWSLYGKRSLAELFVNTLRARGSMKGFSDVCFCSLFVLELADLLLEMAAKNLHGLFHTVSRESLSKYEFGLRIARRFGLDETLITSVRVSEAGLVAARSPNLTLRTDKLATALGHDLPGQETGLERFFQQDADGSAQRLRDLASGIF